MANKKTLYAIYVKSRAEKAAHAELAENGIDCFLPLIKTLKQWSDRKKWVEEPLFRSYLFVHINKPEYYKVLNTAGVVRYITFEGKAVPIPDQQIEAVRFFLSEDEEPPADPHSYQPGQTVEVIKGALLGLTGELIQLAGKHKVRIEVVGIGQAVFITIPMSYLRII